MAFLDFDGLKQFTSELKKYMSEHLSIWEVDDSLSTSSTNPVENQVITRKIESLKDRVERYEQIIFPSEE
jgi:predicted secreted protein